MGKSAQRPSVSWDNSPPSVDQLYIPILSPIPGQILRLVVLGDRPVGVWTHYRGARSGPCLEPAAECEDCRRGSPRRWKAYLAAWDPSHSRYVLAELTTHAVRQNPLLGKDGPNLRGALLYLERVGKHTNAPVKADLRRPEKAEQLLGSFDVHRALMRIWGRPFTADGLEQTDERVTTLDLTERD